MAWFRIEPQSDDPQPGPDRALQARVYDPAWLLGRQWQLGELTGEDAASPAWVRLRMTGAPISRLQLRGATEVHRVAPADLIEPLVEGEAEQDAEWIRSLEAGQHFLAALDAAGLGAEFGTAFRTAYPVLAPDSHAPTPSPRCGSGCCPDAAWTDWLWPRPRVRTARPACPTVRRCRAIRTNCLRQWLAWYPAPVPDAGTAWVPERLEYQFTLAAPHPSGTGEVVLAAPAYQGGRLDWTDLRAAPDGTTLGAAADPGARPWTHSGLPTRVLARLRPISSSCSSSAAASPAMQAEEQGSRLTNEELTAEVAPRSGSGRRCALPASSVVSHP